jgi:hypothetical protein
VDNLTIAQDTDRGYMVNLMLRDGTVNISANWEKWPHPEQDCRDEACYAKYRTKITDLLSQEQLLQIAGAFVSEHGIDVSHYGAPEVDETWKRDYDRAQDKAQAYVPDAQTVVYPLLTEGRPVFDQGGAKQGIRVNVNVRQKLVSDVWGIQNLQYLRSDYAALSGSGDVLDYLAHLDRMAPDAYPQGMKVKRVKVTLGEPTLGYASYFTYENAQTRELIVPALLFPVQNVADGQYLWQQTIAVPLAKDLLKQNQPAYRIMD